ncbi:MAG TPA: GGDEF domain-containing protein [Telluria sp.]
MIDTKTFMLVLAIGNICFAMLMAGYTRSSPVNRAMELWQWAKLVQGCAHFIGWLHPDWLTPYVALSANSALIIGVELEAAAYCSFFNFRRWKSVLFPSLALALLVYGAARLGGASPLTLAVVLSLIFGLLSGVMSLLLLWPRPGVTVLQRIIGANNFVFFVAMALRAWSGVASEDLPAFVSGAAQSFTYVTGYIILIVNGFGFLLLCKEKDDSKLALLATIDSLTGLVNRRAFFEQIEGARMLAARQHHPIALMMLDLDYFKRINDRFGHAAGDEALRVFSAAALSALREPDLMGRLGGEEFAVALPGTDLAGAMHAAERVRSAVEAAPLPQCGAGYAMSVSIGVVAIDPQEHINAALARADHALYAAKSAGRNRVEVGQPMRQTAACA